MRHSVRHSRNTQDTCKPLRPIGDALAAHVRPKHRLVRASQWATGPRPGFEVATHLQHSLTEKKRSAKCCALHSLSDAAYITM